MYDLVLLGASISGGSVDDCPYLSFKFITSQLRTIISYSVVV